MYECIQNVYLGIGENGEERREGKMEGGRDKGKETRGRGGGVIEMN